MNLPPILADNQPAPSDLEFLESQINQHNIAHTGAHDYQALAIFIRNEQQQIIAGLSGYTWAGMCEMQFLWVHPNLRRRGFGRHLLAAAEQEAHQRGCSMIILHTYSFQAPGFYQHHGYELVGSIEVTPPGHSIYYFKKPLHISPGSNNIHAPHKGNRR